MRDAITRDQDLFRNALCILESLDRDVLVAAGVLDAHDEDGWAWFRGHPFRAYRGLDDERQKLCFALVQLRLAADLRSASQPTPYALLSQADAALHDRDDEHGQWAHALVHQAASHLSPDAEIRAQVAVETPRMLAAVGDGERR